MTEDESNSKNSEEYETDEDEPLIGSSLEEGQWGILGEFYQIDEIMDVGSFDIGDMSLSIEKVQLVQGRFNKDENELMDEEREFISLIMDLNIPDNKGEDYHETIDFDIDYMSVTTDTGEHIETSEMYSSMIMPLTMQISDALVSVSYEIEDSNIDEIDAIAFEVESPVDIHGDPLGEDVEVEIEI
ncbi:hypothetical protein [Salicibibacter kimchii]|uniref:Uncharacterized protein n=1 Tax=Salicibibacter kimchii TaxID=2099786 RepID=A0A345BX87_9BACI|nr:hypothetical protein [Salicibibacter kimchii]AXF55568.1 hypothetical protein DT065_05725 [Salicibibacter kimchii]